MAAPAVVASTSGKGGGNQTINYGGATPTLVIIAITTQAESLPIASGQISNISSPFTAILGTKGGAGYNTANTTGIYTYVFAHTYIGGSATSITTGDSGFFQIWQCWEVTGYNVNGSLGGTTTFSSTVSGETQANGSGVLTVPGFTTQGPDRLILGLTANTLDSNTAFAGTWANSNLTSITQNTPQESSLGSGGGLTGFYGTVASTGTAIGNTTATDALFASTYFNYWVTAISPYQSGSAALTGTGSMTADGEEVAAGGATPIIRHGGYVYPALPERK